MPEWTQTMSCSEEDLTFAMTAYSPLLDDGTIDDVTITLIEDVL